MNGSYVTIRDGQRIYHEIHGTGRPLVLLHGAFGTIEACFADLIPALASTRQVIALELQGHGHTPDIDRPLGFPAMAEDTIAVLDELGVEEADFLGYSMGGGVAVHIAIHHPQRVRRLVYAGGACYQPEGYHPELLADIGAMTPEDMDGSVWQRSYARVAPDPDAWPTLITKMQHMDLSFTGWTEDEIRSVSAPTLLIVGDSDIVRPEHTVAMFRLLGGGVIGDLVGLPKSQLAVLPGTTHVGLLARTGWLLSMITAFLDEQR
jgi:pimeloyl-ACP methyl ester carboxylesterase